MSVCLSTGGGSVSRLRQGVVRSSRGGGQVQLAGGGFRSSQQGGSGAVTGASQVQPAGGGQVQLGGQPAGWGDHYTAGGMPLAFTQEDFLVVFVLDFQ